ncbi:MAG: DUF998 domain-containing protein [Actinomycetota bacterium]|nr:DUF998 domain-containing protein [Actinomycetota bacterium]
MNRSAPSSASLPLAAFATTAAFPFLIVVLHFVQLGHYHPLRQAVSELALGRAGWLMAIAFCSSGIGSLLIAIVLRRIATQPRVAPTLLATTGLLSFVSAFVHADGSGPTTTHGQIHQFVGIATFLLIIAAMFTLVRPFRRDPVWRSVATPTLAWAIAAVACIFLVPISGAAYFGVAQRILLATLLSWLLTVSLHAHRTRHSRQTSPVLGMATQLAADEHRNLAPHPASSAN